MRHNYLDATIQRQTTFCARIDLLTFDYDQHRARSEAEPKYSQGIYEAVSLQCKYYDYMQAMAMTKREIKGGLIRWQQLQRSKDHAHLSNMVEESHFFKVLDFTKRAPQVNPTA